MPRVCLSAFCLLLCWSSAAFPMSCKWLQPGQELVSKNILLSFQRLSDKELFALTCLQSTFPPNIDFIYNNTQVEDAVLTLYEVTHQINKFYTKAGPVLGYNDTAMRPLQAALKQMTNNLRDCISVNSFNSTINWETRKAIFEYFRTLAHISSEKNNQRCARHVVQVQVEKQLQIAVQLTTSVRKMNILMAPSTS